VSWFESSAFDAESEEGAVGPATKTIVILSLATATFTCSGALLRAEDSELFLPVAIECPTDSEPILEMKSANTLRDIQVIRVSFVGREPSRVTVMSREFGSLDFRVIFDMGLDDPGPLVKYARKALGKAMLAGDPFCFGTEGQHQRIESMLEASRSKVKPP
jgi:hypothetical protein